VTPARPAGRRGHPGVQHVRRRRRPDRRQRGDGVRAAALSPPTRSSRPPTPASAGDRDHRGHPRPRRAARLHPLQRTGTRLVGPTARGSCPPGKANVGIIPASFFKEGNVGVVSRSGTLTYQIGNTLAQAGFGNSSIVGIGGDPVPGSSFIDIIELFEADEQTELIVLSGEIGGGREERAAEHIDQHVTKPVVAYIAGFTAPPGKTMATPARSSRAPRHRRPPRPKHSRPGRPRRPHPTQVAEIAVEILGG